MGAVAPTLNWVRGTVPVPDRDALLAAIVAAAPADTAPLLAYADWLAANGEPERAEFVRLQTTPPADQSSLPRLNELYAAHGRRWFAPAYDLVRASVYRTADPTAALSALGEASARFVSATTGVPVGPPGGRPLDQPATGLVPIPVQEQVHPWGVSITLDPMANAQLRSGNSGLDAITRPQSTALISRGVVTHASLNESALRRQQAVIELLSGEPVSELTLDLPADPGLWRRIDGPHLRRVGHLTLDFHPAADADGYALTAAAVFGSPHLSGVTALSLQAGSTPTITTGFTSKLRWVHAPTDGVVEQLLASPLLPRLKSLSFTGGGGPGWLSAVAALAATTADVKLESFALHSWEHTGKRPVPLPDVAAAIARLPFRSRLKSIHLSGVPLGPVGVRQLLAGGPWDRLETLLLTAAAAGDGGAGAIADTTALPALRHLALSNNRIGDGGAKALAASPLARRLGHLDLSLNPIGDVGVEAVAALLDGHQLRMVNLATACVATSLILPARASLGWFDRLCYYVTLPLALPFLLLGRMLQRGRGIPMPLTPPVSREVRERLKGRYGDRIHFGL